MSTIREQLKTTFLGLAGLLSKMNVMQNTSQQISGKVDEVSGKIDGIKDTFDADMALQLQSIIGESEESVEGNSQTEGEIKRLRTLQESYDALVGDSKQTIVDAINQMGGSATADMTWAQLAQEMQNLPQDIFDPRVKFQDTLQRPIDILGILINHFNGVEEFYTDMSGNVDLVRCVGASNSTIKKFHAPNITTIPTNSSATNPVGVGVIEVFMESLTAIPPYFLWSYPPIRKLYCPNVSSVSSDSMHTANLIDFYIGGAFVSSINLRGSKYDPTEAYRTDTSSLCFDTDLEEYGQAFNNNWEKWKWCIINHFAANLQDRTGLTAYTIEFGSTVLSHFDAEMIAAFTDKNWTLA